VILYHFYTRILPGFNQPLSNLDLIRGLPYALVVVAVVYLFHLRKNRNDSYKEFLRNSPGIEVNTGDIEYGIGHGYNNNNQN
jgi:hypothetical protein